MRLISSTHYPSFSRQNQALSFGQKESKESEVGGKNAAPHSGRPLLLQLGIPALTVLTGLGAGELAGPLLSDCFMPRAQVSTAEPQLTGIQQELDKFDRKVAQADFRSVIQEMAPASVVIRCQDEKPSSGFLFRSADGQIRILTHYSVLPISKELNRVHDAKYQRISETDFEKRRYQIQITPAPNAQPVILEARVAKTSQGKYAASYDSGLGVLEFTQPLPASLQTLKLFRFSDEKPELAMPVVAMGNENGKFRATQGVISHLGRKIPDMITETNFPSNEQGEKPMFVPGAKRIYLGTDVPVNLNSNGAVLMNRQGELVGLLFEYKTLFVTFADHMAQVYTGGVAGTDGLHIAFEVQALKETLTNWGLAP